MCAIDKWFKHDGTILEKTVTLTITPTVVFTADPLRFYANLCASSSTNVYYAFSRIQPTTNQFLFNTNNAVLVVTDDELSDLITQPLWGWCQSGTATVDIVVQSYNAERKRLYDQWFLQQLALKLGTPGPTPASLRAVIPSRT